MCLVRPRTICVMFSLAMDSCVYELLLPPLRFFFGRESRIYTAPSPLRSFHGCAGSIGALAWGTPAGGAGTRPRPSSSTSDPERKGGWCGAGLYDFTVTPRDFPPIVSTLCVVG